MKQQTIHTLVAAILAAGGLSVSAQSSDVLLNKLIQKGILSEQEAADVKKESAANFDKAYTSKTGLPDWVTQLKISGDVRGRYEMFRFDNDDAGGAAPNKPRDRFRYRLRAGATVTMKENIELGFRLTSSEPNDDGTGGDPISGNATAQNNGSKKFLYIDTAYGKWTPLKTDTWSAGATIGKMDNPFVLSDMVFDHDYTPEGAALQVGYNLNKQHSLKFNGGYFLLDEINQGANASNDPFMLGAQLRYDGKLASNLGATLGVAWLAMSEAANLTNGAVPNVNVGNTRDNTTGALVNDYFPIVVDAAVTYSIEKSGIYPGALPIRLAADFMHNPGAGENNQGWSAGLTVGKAAKKGTWEAGYRYKYLENDAWYEEFVDSDFGAYYTTAPLNGVGQSGKKTGYLAGTGVAGHIVKVAYAVSDSFSVSGTWFYTGLIESQDAKTGANQESGQHRIQLDATWKF
jgi:hypothetical protein